MTPPEVTDVTVTTVTADPASLDYSVYDVYEGNTMTLHASIDALIEFDGYVDKEYADQYEEEDDDWDEDDTILIGFSRQVRLWFDLIVIGSELENVAVDYAELA